MKDLMENLRNMNSSQILAQDFLRCDNSKNILEEQHAVQKTFFQKILTKISKPVYIGQPIYEIIDEIVCMKTLYSKPLDDKELVYNTVCSEESIYTTIDEAVYMKTLYSKPLDDKELVYNTVCSEESIYTTIDEAVYMKTLYSKPFADKEPVYNTACSKGPIYETIHIQKSESAISKKSLLTIEGSFKKRDGKNLQKIKNTTEILDIYSPGQVNFDVRFNLILSDLKKIKSSSGKLAAFLYVLDSTKGLNQANSKKLYKQLPRKYKKLIKKSNPKFSLDMHSAESLKSIESIRAHLEKRSIFIKAEPFPLKDRI